MSNVVDSRWVCHVVTIINVKLQLVLCVCLAGNTVQRPVSARNPPRGVNVTAGAA